MYIKSCRIYISKSRAYIVVHKTDVLLACVGCHVLLAAYCRVGDSRCSKDFVLAPLWSDELGLNLAVGVSVEHAVADQDSCSIDFRVSQYHIGSCGSSLDWGVRFGDRWYLVPCCLS